MAMKYALTAVLTACLSGLAAADEVQLKNGRTLVGIAHEESTRVVVETRLGDIGVPRDEVRAIVPGRTAIHEYQERLAAIDACPWATEVFDLALWARDQRLIRYVHQLLQRTIELDPDHAEARKLLGDVREGDCWIPASERETMRSIRARSQHRAAARVRRTTPAAEPVSYSLGIPPGPPRRGSSTWGGGYSLWQGVVSTRNLPNIPLTVPSTR